LQNLRAAIHIIAEEQIVGFRREAAILEKPKQIRILAW
jgi:hypothetical protein